MDYAVVLERWIAASPTPLDPNMAEGWVRLLAGAKSDRMELAGLVALNARSAGEDGQPPSRLLGQLLALAELARGTELESAASALPGLAVDAHAIGVATRAERRRARRLLTGRPVLPLPGGRILACAVGPLDGEGLDALLGRAFTLAVGRGAEVVWLELGGAEDLDSEWLLDALRGFAQHELAGKLRIELCGVSPIERWVEAVRARGLEPHVGVVDPFTLLERP